MDRIDKMPELPGDDEAREERLGELINDFFDRRRSGENISQEDFLAQHPDDADDLREHFQGLDLLTGLGSSSGDTAMAPLGKHTAAGAGSSEVVRAAEIPLPAIPGYDVQKQIGRGGMGIVYRATQISTKRQAALKLLMEGPYASDQARKRFEREIALAAQLRHPNIIPIYDSGSFDGRMYYAMEYVRGHSLTDYLRMHRPDVAAKLRLFVKVCAPIQYAHQRGVVHRDIKPSNVLIDADGEPHVLDFGLAKAAAMGDATASLTAQILGTPAYMSPEQASGDTDSVDIRTDIYSLGIVLYEMLTGVMPYETNISMGKILDNIAHAEPIPPSKHDKRISNDLSAIVLKALEKSKHTRYQSVDAFADDLNRYLAGEPISVRPSTTFYILKKAAIKHRAFVGITAALLICGCIFGFIVHRLSEAQIAIRTKENELVAIREEKAKLKHEAEDANLSREAAEKKGALYETLVSQLPPEWGPAVDVTKALGDSVERGEDPNTLFATLLAKGLSNVAANQGTSTTPTANVAASKNAPQSPTDANTKQRPAYQLSPELVQLLRALVPSTGTPQQARATTQPAPTGPAEASRPNPTTHGNESS